ncbi:MAG: hypothetical protein ACRCT8_08650 [Lacipirellulaceae bacterium]
MPRSASPLRRRAASRLLLAGATFGAGPAALGDEPAALLTPRAAVGDCALVEVDVEIGGDLYPLAPAGADPKSGTKLPVTITAELDYGQRLAAVEKAPAAGRRALRAVTKVGATIGIGSGNKKTTVREPLRRLVAESHADGAIYATAGALTRDELDLLDLPGDPLYADRLLPTVAVAEGASWDVTAEALGPLLALDATQLCEVSAVVTELQASHAKFRFAGVVHGTDEGAETKLDVRGVALFDRRVGCVTQLNLAYHEERAAGPATPAIDTNTKLNVRVTPAKDVASLAGAKAPTAPARAEDLLLELEGPGEAWTTKHDRLWHITAVDRTNVTLRRVTEAGATGQMTFTLQSPVRADRTPTLATLERDVRYALDKNLQRVAGSSDWTTAEGLACLGIVSQGAIDGAAVEWRHYLAFPPLGGRVVSVATTIDEPLAAALGDADRQLVESLEVAAVPATTGARPATVR